MNVNYFHAEPGFMFSSKHCRSRSDSSLHVPYQDPHCSSSLLVNTCSLITDENLGEIQCIVYKINRSIISKEMHQTFIHAHTPTHNFRFWPKRPPLAFSVAETSMAEMSGPKRPRPKCPWPKCPTFNQSVSICLLDASCLLHWLS